MNRFFQFTLAFALALLVSGHALAAPPQTINYQGYLTNPGGTAINAPVSMTLRLYNTASGGTALWTETQPSVTVTNGNFNAVLGSVTPIPLPFDVPYWLSVQVNADAEMSPRQPLASSAYAFRATTATTATTASTAAAIQGIAVSAVAPTDGQVLIFRSGQWQPAADLDNLLASVSALNAAVNALISPRAYVTNRNAGTVTVIDTNINTVVGAPITVGLEPRSIALNPSGSRAYVANAGSNNVTVIDTSTNTVVGVAITVGSGPYGIAVK